MKLNSKVTWGLAWTGLAVVLAVPSADFLTGKLGAGSNAALITSTTDPVKTAATSTDAAPQKTSTVTTTLTDKGVIITPAGSTPPKDAVARFEESGKKLPDYITGGTATPATTTAAASPVLTTPSGQASGTDTTRLASLDTAAAATPPAPVVAPVPFPSRPPDAVRAVVSTPAIVGSVAAPAATPATDPVVIVDENKVTPPAPIVPSTSSSSRPVPPAPIADDSANWRGNGLEQYLDRNGLLDKGRSSASVTVVDRSSDYDPNGFYLSDGPNNARAARRARVEALFDDEDYSDSPPQSFNLF